MSERSLVTIAAAIRTRRMSPVEAVGSCLDRVQRLDKRMRAFIRLDESGALGAAKALEADAAAGRWRGPLHGVPVAFKDLCHLEGLPTSCGTKTAEYFISSQECTAARRLLDAGAISLGKLNMTELAMGPYGDNAHHGDVDNPWRAGHCAGGSSSGSGAGVAAGFFLGALGTDTGGSIRLPAACCGIVGLKPTYGRVSRAGAMPLSWSMDHIGPLTRTVADAALLLEIVAGYDSRDPTSSRRGVPYYQRMLEGPIADLRLGVPENYYFDGLDAEMEAGVRGAVATLATLGAHVAEIRLPDPQVLNATTGLISRSESSALHARLLRDRPQELDAFTRARLELGLGVPAYDYLQALRLRARLARAFTREVWSLVDLLAVPV